MYKKSLSACAVMIIFAGCAEAPIQSTPTVVKETPVQAASPKPSPTARPRAAGTPEDARRHMLRGMAAVEMAKTADDLAAAEDEFKMATEIAPKMSAAWFNLAKTQAQMEQYGEAIKSYKKYLAIEPRASDAPRVRDEIVKLEFRQEQIKKSRGSCGQMGRS